MILNYKKIVSEAWLFTRANKGMTFWYAAIPSFFTTLYSIGVIVYQYYSFMSSPLFGNWDQSFTSIIMERIISFIQENQNMIIPLIILTILSFIAYLILPVFCDAALIQLIARKKNGQDVRIRNGISYGMYSFLPLFEYSLLIKTFSLWSVVTIMILTVRNLGVDTLALLLPVFIITLIISTIIAVIFVFTEFYIVIDSERVFASIGKSVTLVIKHLEETILLSILMILIFLRIIVQLLFVFFLPVLVIWLLYVFSSYNLPQLAVLISTGVGTLGMLFAAYLNGTIHMFTLSVWTFTFLHLTTEKDTTARDAPEEITT